MNRFGGHAVRRNIALVHREDVMRSAVTDLWRAAYEAARAVEHGLGTSSPTGSTRGRTPSKDICFRSS